MISRADERDGGFNCPFCGASVVGTICQCGVEFKEESVLQAQQRRSKPEKTNQWKCPRCGELNIKGASNCKHCSVGFRYEPETPKIDYRAIQIQDLAGKVSDLEANITALDDAQKPQQKAEQRELKCPSCGEPIKTYGASNCKHCSVGFKWEKPQTPKKDPWQAEYEQEKARTQGLTEQVSVLEGKVKQYEAQQAAGPKLKKVRAAVETKTSVPAAGAPAQKPTEAFALLGVRKVHGSEFITTKRPGSDAPFEYRLGGPRGDRVILPDGSWPSTGTNYATLVELYNKAKTQKPQGEAALPTYVMIEERELETIINKQGAVESKLKEKTSAHSTLQAKYEQEKARAQELAGKVSDLEGELAKAEGASQQVEQLKTEYNSKEEAYKKQVAELTGQKSALEEMKEQKPMTDENENFWRDLQELARQSERQQAAGPKLKKVRAAAETKTSVPATGTPTLAQKPEELPNITSVRFVDGGVEYVLASDPAGTKHILPAYILPSGMMIATTRGITLFNDPTKLAYVAMGDGDALMRSLENKPNLEKQLVDSARPHQQAVRNLYARLTGKEDNVPQKPRWGAKWGRGGYLQPALLFGGLPFIVSASMPALTGALSGSYDLTTNVELIKQMWFSFDSQYTKMLWASSGAGAALAPILDLGEYVRSKFQRNKVAVKA